jgi:hypothetical protein
VGVFLVGGGSRMPLVATMLHRALGVAPTLTDDIEQVVARGAIVDTERARIPTPPPIPVQPAAPVRPTVPAPVRTPAPAPTTPTTPASVHPPRPVKLKPKPKPTPKPDRFSSNETIWTAVVVQFALVVYALVGIWDSSYYHGFNRYLVFIVALTAAPMFLKGLRTRTPAGRNLAFAGQITLLYPVVYGFLATSGLSKDPEIVATYGAFRLWIVWIIGLGCVITFVRMLTVKEAMAWFGGRQPRRAYWTVLGVAAPAIALLTVLLTVLLDEMGP